jgi:hypothetical protein
MPCFLAEVNLIWEEEIVWPFNDFLVSVFRFFGAERRVTDETLKHDSTQ